MCIPIVVNGAKDIFVPKDENNQNDAYERDLVHRGYM